MACYYFNHYHRSSLNDARYGNGWTEHVLRRAARPWFPGHRQPRSPLWGELDETDPLVMERYIDAAVGHGVDAFIFEQYWFGGRPQLHECLERGFLCAPNRDRMKFALMWIPSDWPQWFPDQLQDGSIRRPLKHLGPKTPEDVRRSFLYLLSRYTAEPNYLLVDGKPFVAIWKLANLEHALGADGVRRFFEEMREVARTIGHRGLHLHACKMIYEPFVECFDSFGVYNSISSVKHKVAQGRPTVPFDECAYDVAQRLWPELDAAHPLPFFPNIGAGWDDTPRNPMPPTWPPPEGWPGLPFVVDESPAAFEALARAAIAYVNGQPKTPNVVTIGCWNEWTEGHYLLPDCDRGMGMLYALAKARGGEPFPWHYRLMYDRSGAAKRDPSIIVTGDAFEGGRKAKE
jgi:hypothetical protein